MRISSHTIVVAAALALASSVSSDASTAVDPNTLPKVECLALHYDAAFLAKHPKTPAACLEARVYKGHRYMKVKGQVYIAGTDSMTITFQNVAGDPLDTVTVKRSVPLRVIVDGKEADIADLPSGKELTFWIPESIFSAQSTTGDS
jgi:hypothetical protein